ncbi:ABC transporter permease [Halovivax gelatinilyticus]|uniref:ABC transporter permease n=1 Tax=Halovivax gelatinilyticus TaxID=2961597 RepID=UPI0020CA79CF|nr:ABC transporter permease [Halovivax gelatinilyticus]
MSPGPDRTDGDGEPRSVDVPSVTDGVRRARWSGLVRLALARFRGQLTGATPGRSVAIVLAVSLTIALLLVVTGLALALVDDGTASQHDATVQIEPDDERTFASIDAVERPRLANASAQSSSIRSEPGVEYATPVLSETVAATGSLPEQTEGTVDVTEIEYHRILAVGIEPDERAETVAGLPVDELAPSGDSGGNDTDGATDEGDSSEPMDGDPTGIVLSESAADRLDVAAGDDVYVSRDGDLLALSVLAVEPGDGTGETPVALVRLDALQLFAGADEHDLADRVLVWGDEDDAVAASEAAYPDASVRTTGSTHPRALFGDGLALATSLIALVVGVVICGLFVATTAGMAVAEDRRQIATLVAVGVPVRSCLLVVTIATLATVLVGALVGLALGTAAIFAADGLAAIGLTTESSLVAFHPLVLPYGLVVALFAGVLAISYPLAITARTDVLSEVNR